MRNPFRRIKELVEEPIVDSRSLAELCDEYIAFLGPYDRNRAEVWRLKEELYKLMGEENIQYIARKDTLLERSYSDVISISPLDRLGPDVFSEDTKGAHLIPLVDQLLEADGAHERNEEARDKLALPLARAAKREGKAAGYKCRFIYRGYGFSYYLSRGSAGVSVDHIADLDG